MILVSMSDMTFSMVLLPSYPKCTKLAFKRVLHFLPASQLTTALETFRQHQKILRRLVPEML